MVVRLSGTQPQGPKHLETLENKTVDGTQNTVRVNRGATANRPAFPVVGEFYYNTDKQAFEQYTLAGWFNIAQAPSAPTSVIATDQGSGREYNNGQASVAFTPNSNGGAPSSFVVTPSPATSPATFTTTSSPVTITGLSSSTQYTYTVTASGTYGTSTSSAASAGVTATTVPQAPTIGTALGSSNSSGTATVSFTAGATGGSAITQYSIVSNPETTTQTTSSSPYTFTGLTLDNSYSFKVSATNSNGASLYSSFSNSVIPASVPPQTYFISYDSGADIYLNSSTTDSSDNVYAVGQWSNNNGYLVKYNSNGVGQWYRRFYESAGSPYDWGNNIVINPNNDLWISHTTDLSGANSPAISKVSPSDGTFLSTTFLRSSSGGNNYPYDIARDTSNNIFITGQGDYDGAGFKLYTCKFNSSGVLQWQRRYTTNWSTGYAVAADGTGASYTGGRHNGSGSYKAFLGKRNSSGTSQWQNVYTESGGGENYLYDIEVDSNDNTYFISIAGTTGSYTSHLVKIDNSTGSIVWQRKINGTPVMVCVTTDITGNVYVGGSNGTGNGLIMKYSSSGTLQWTRTMTNSYGPNRIRWSKNSLFLSNSGGSPVNAWTIKVPDDGSKTGTYTNGGITHFYAVGSISDAAGTLTASAGGTTDDAGSMSIQTGLTMTNIAASPTRYNTII